MQSKITLLVLLCFMVVGNVLSAQTSVSNNNSSIAFAPADETFFEDSDNHIIYIDFEAVTVNLSDVKVKDASGEIVMSDELWSLPVNTIYEIDYSKFTPGDYEIELRSFTGVLRKKISIK